MPVRNSLSTGERLAELRARHDQLHGSANKKARHKLNLKIRVLEQQMHQEQEQEEEVVRILELIGL